MAGESSAGVARVREVLPSAVKPIKYKLKLEPYLTPPAEGQSPDEVFTFDGTVDIVMEISEKVDEIKLNALELSVKKAALMSSSEVETAVSDISMDTENQVVTLKLDNEVNPGEYTISVTFSGLLNDKMAGFYRSGYKDADSGEMRYMAVTQFEPTDARRSFPCFDEPSQKAIFEVTLVAPASLDCLSNMPIVSETVLENGKKAVKFEDSPIMSTYLLAYCVGEFDYIEGTTSNGVVIRVYTLRKASHLGTFALDVGLKTLDLYTEFFSIPYPLPKLDMIAVPDFSAGAMENWGLVTYRETALLLDPDNSSAAAKSRVAEVVAHELAHQWFGNLVTMEWWTDLWLNEGFATWCADLAVDTLFPDWETWMQFVGGTLSGALRLDALRSSHPIEVPVYKAQEVNEIFDHISYYKGASVIRMLANYLSVESFQKGLAVYLNKFKYRNAVTVDLWEALENESGKPVAATMSSWTKQTGYPLLSVSSVDSSTVKITQQRFLSDGSVSEEDAAVSWIVPIGYISGSAPEDKKYVLMEDKELSVSASSSTWLKVNEGQSGVYRVCYSPEMYLKLMDPIRSQQLPTVDRLGLLMDVMALARAGYAPITSALDILAAFNKEIDYTCVSNVISSLHEIIRVFGTAETRPVMHKFGRELLSHVASVVGWEPKSTDGHVTSLLRAAVLNALQEFGDPATIETCKTRFAGFLKDPKSLPADLRVPVYFAAVKNGGQEEVDALIRLHDESDLNEEKVRCIRALGEVDSEERLKAYLEWGSTNVKPQDLLYVMHCAASNPAGHQLAWDYAKANWGNWIAKYGKGNFLLTRFMESATGSFSSEARAVEVAEFYKTVDTEGVERKLAQCLEGIRVRAAWIERDSAAVAEWFSQK